MISVCEHNHEYKFDIHTANDTHVHMHTFYYSIFDAFFVSQYSIFFLQFLVAVKLRAFIDAMHYNALQCQSKSTSYIC